MSVTIPTTEIIDLSLLKVDGQNPNRMTAKQHEALKQSFKRWGFIIPIITNKDLLIADGEQRLLVAKEMGVTKAPVVRLPVEDVDRRLLRQVLNKLKGEHELIADAHEFELIIKGGEEQSLKQLLQLNDSQIERYLSEIHEPKTEDFNISEIDAIETDIKRGDIYQLGHHRLMCGDATIKKNVDILMDAKKVDMLYCDPPFGVYKGSWGNSLRERNFDSVTKRRELRVNRRVYNDVNPDEYEPWAIKWTKNVVFNDYNTVYIWINSVCLRQLLNALYTNNYVIRHSLVWAKQHFVMSNIDYYPQHELCLYGWKGKHRFYGKHRSDIIFVDRPIKSKVHPTMKPMKLNNPLIQDGSIPNGLVLDLFGGSGSTLISCEQTGRQCYMMEIEPGYCQIIINRWETYTNQKAEKLN